MVYTESILQCSINRCATLFIINSIIFIFISFIFKRFPFSILLFIIYYPSNTTGGYLTKKKRSRRYKRLVMRLVHIIGSDYDKRLDPYVPRGLFTLAYTIYLWISCKSFTYPPTILINVPRVFFIKCSSMIKNLGLVEFETCINCTIFYFLTNSFQ